MIRRDCRMINWMDDLLDGGSDSEVMKINLGMVSELPSRHTLCKLSYLF